MRAWHDGVAAALDEAKAQGVSLAELNDALWRELFIAHGLGPLLVTR